MELKRGFKPRTILITLYVVAFVLYIIYGLQPTGATGISDQDNISRLVIPSVALESDVQQLELSGGELKTPGSVVGEYSRNDDTTLLIGHASTVFSRLRDIRLGDLILLDGESYEVKKIRLSLKDDIDMDELLNESGHETLVLMTCAGRILDDGDATFRLIVFASA